MEARSGREGNKAPPGTLAFIWVRTWPIRKAVVSSLDPLNNENRGVCSHNTHRKKDHHPDRRHHSMGQTQVLVLSQGV